MELRHLRYFVGVARELNFTRAARQLRVAQPALSRQIRQLEEEVGVPLFERSRSRVTLTAAGNAFLAEVTTLLAQSERAVRAARSTGPAGGRPLNIGYVWGLFHTVAPAAIARFRQARPDTAVNLFDLTATEQALAVSEGRLDAGFIGFADEAEAAKLARRSVGRCDFVAALPAGHPLARRARVSLGALATEPFYVISEANFPGAARRVLEACSLAGFRPRIRQCAERGHTILGLVAGERGVALLPEPLCALPHPGVVFRPLVEPPGDDLFVVWRDGVPGPVLADFVAACGPSPQPRR